MDRLAISPTNITAPPWLSIRYGTLASQYCIVQYCFTLYCTVLYCTVLYCRWETVATDNQGVFTPTEEFQQNILTYRYNRFLDIGELGRCQ